MSEPDTIKTGWTIGRLWLLWCSFAAGSVAVSVLLGRLPCSPKRETDQV
jgi:hypothetical protein